MEISDFIGVSYEVYEEAMSDGRHLVTLLRNGERIDSHLTVYHEDLEKMIAILERVMNNQPEYDYASCVRT